MGNFVNKNYSNEMSISIYNAMSISARSMLIYSIFYFHHFACYLLSLLMPSGACVCRRTINCCHNVLITCILFQLICRCDEMKRFLYACKCVCVCVGLFPLVFLHNFWVLCVYVTCVLCACIVRLLMLQ